MGFVAFVRSFYPTATCRAAAEEQEAHAPVDVVETDTGRRLYQDLVKPITRKSSFRRSSYRDLVTDDLPHFIGTLVLQKAKVK